MDVVEGEGDWHLACDHEEEEGGEQSAGQADSAVQRRVIDSLNSFFGSEVGEAERAAGLHAELTTKLAQLDKKLDNANSAAPNQLQISLKRGDLVISRIKLSWLNDVFSQEKRRRR